MTRRAICSVSCVALLTFFSATNAQGQQPHRSVTEVSMKNIVEGVMLVIMLAGLIGGVWNRFKLGKGIGLRFIQYIGLTFVVLFFVILSLARCIINEEI